MAKTASAAASTFSCNPPLPTKPGSPTAISASRSTGSCSVTRSRLSPPAPGRRSAAASNIAVVCDIRIGSKEAIFGYPQVKFGLTPYSSPQWKIIGLSQAKLLTLSGQRIDADEALRIGLIDRLVETGAVVAAATSLAEEIAATTTKSAMFNKELMLRSPTIDPISALSFETSMYREVIWHPDVTARLDSAYAAMRKTKDERTTHG